MSRPEISRRSCDQCRARKIRCDRDTPCSNCNSARLDCTHSAVASSSSISRQRVPLSAQYEEKIDEIAKGINGIQTLLRGSQISRRAAAAPPGSASWPSADAATIKFTIQDWPNDSPTERTSGSHGTSITKFIRDLARNTVLINISLDEQRTVSTLQRFLQILENHDTARILKAPNAKVHTDAVNLQMPPLEATLMVLRWARAHHSCGRMFWLSRILPQERFVEICRKVYFAVDDFDDFDLALANGYLFYVFAEHATESGTQISLEYNGQCRRNFQDQLERLPLLLQPSLEAISALTLGAMHALEKSTLSIAWTYISAALNMCQVLGYHRAHVPEQPKQQPRTVEEHLFWTVYRFERAVALRTNRSSSIRDGDITIHAKPVDAYFSKIGRLQGQIYDQLYSPVASSQAMYAQRLHAGKALTTELYELIESVNEEISNCQHQPELSERTHEHNHHTQISACSGSDCNLSTVRILYLQFDLLCHYSSLALVFRAMAPSPNLTSNTLEESVAMARQALDMHEVYMDSLRRYSSDPLLVTKYVSWAVINAPFVSFSILFSRVIQLFDIVDLERLERFAASLEPAMKFSESGTHPCQLYDLLCRAARIHITQNVILENVDQNVVNENSVLPLDVHFTHFEPSTALVDTQDTLADFGFSTPSMLSDWFRENQQVMSLLDEDVMF